MGRKAEQPIVKQNGNGSLRQIPSFWMSVMGVTLAGIVTYYTSQITIAAQMEKRPTREEVEQKIDGVQKEVKENLKEIKEQQRALFDKLDKLNDTLNQFVIRQLEKEKNVRGR